MLGVCASLRCVCAPSLLNSTVWEERAVSYKDSWLKVKWPRVCQ